MIQCFSAPGPEGHDYVIRRNYMRKIVFIGFITILASIGAATAGSGPEPSRCKDADGVCKEFESLAQAGQFEKIVNRIDRTKQYSEEARRYIGHAYLQLAAVESNTPEQEEAFCRKAIEFGATQAYMGLYFIHVQKDGDKALEFLRQYIATKPRDSVPYVILGESELNRKNYQLADTYLRESKKVSRANSIHVDWMLFQANYLLGNYEYASERLETAMNSGKFDQDLKALASDARFEGMFTRPEFRKFQEPKSAAH